MFFTFFIKCFIYLKALDLQNFYEINIFYNVIASFGGC